jgi:hypothetical protein
MPEGYEHKVAITSTSGQQKVMTMSHSSRAGRSLSMTEAQLPLKASHEAEEHWIRGDYRFRFTADDTTPSILA